MTSGEMKPTAAFGLFCGSSFGVGFFSPKRLRRVNIRFNKMRENKAKSLN